MYLILKSGEIFLSQPASGGRDEGRTAALMKAAGPLRLMSCLRSLSIPVPTSLIKKDTVEGGRRRQGHVGCENSPFVLGH